MRGAPVDWVMHEAQSSAWREGSRQLAKKPSAVLIVRRPDWSIFDVVVAPANGTPVDYLQEAAFD